MSSTTTTERPDSSGKPVRWRSACNQCHSAKVRCSGERTGCSRCSNLQYECVYAVSRVGKVPGIRARGNKPPRTATSEATTTAQRPRTSTPQQDADGDTDIQTAGPESDEQPSRMDFGDKADATDADHFLDASTPKSHTGLYPDWADPSSDKSLNPFDAADLFVLPSQLMSSENDPGRSSRCPSLHPPSHHSQSAGNSHTHTPVHANTPFLDPGMLSLDLPDLPDLDLPDLDLHIHDFHPMDLPMGSLSTPTSTPVTTSNAKRRSIAHSDLQCGYPNHSMFQYSENASSAECESECGRLHHQQYNYRSWTILSCNRIVEFLEHRIQRGVTALDVVMHTNKVTLGEISRLISQGAHKERSNCAMLLLIAIEQIITLFERSVGQGRSDSDRGSIMGSLGSMGNMGSCKPASHGENSTSSNVLPNLRFGLFQISQDEQVELRSYLLQRELQRCIQVIATLRDSITLEPNPCTKLEERVGKLSSAI
ncbi:uncharacterized protein GIQ15_02476 [Arthroderma uncinatum]|uniref:uncharacterized protein n=1 Tax=Arthroderma uncinatum TaxID=74035 RepID=UPI00144A8FC8|nr:uncharacterized protein GIQ15_02476 [Arthroderma uncinatum]KAF3483152.1 hypothetical protein GIQ15_02476 [Arthroderma uncinatum]